MPSVYLKENRDMDGFNGVHSPEFILEIRYNEDQWAETQNKIIWRW